LAEPAQETGEEHGPSRGGNVAIVAIVAVIAIAAAMVASSNNRTIMVVAMVARS